MNYLESCLCFNWYCRSSYDEDEGAYWEAADVDDCPTDAEILEELAEEEITEGETLKLKLTYFNKSPERNVIVSVNGIVIEHF